MDGSSHRYLSDEGKLLPDRERLGASGESDRRRIADHDERLSSGWRRSSYDAVLRSAKSAALKSGPGGSLARPDQLAFVDITNLRSPDAPHVHGMEMRWIDLNHNDLTFLLKSGNKESREQIDLKGAAKKHD